jgi:hypothetical protein
VDSIEGPAQAGSDWETFFMAKAKIVRKAAVKKVPKAAPPSVKPVKQTLTKSALINLLAEENEIPRKTAAAVYATLENLFLGSVHPRGVGEFILPGLLNSPLTKSSSADSVLWPRHGGNQRWRWGDRTRFRAI